MQFVNQDFSWKKGPLSLSSSDDVVNHWMDGSTLRRKKAIVSTTEKSEQASTDDGGPLRTGL